MARTPTTTTRKKTRTQPQGQSTGEPFIVLKSRVSAGVRGLQKRKNGRGGYVTENELIQHLDARGRLHPTRYPGYKLYAMHRIAKTLREEALLEETPEGMSVPEGVGFSDEEGEAGNDSEQEVAAQNSLFAIGSLTRSGVAQNRSSTRTRQKKQASSSSPSPVSSVASSSASGVGTSVVGSATPVSAGVKSRKAPAPSSTNAHGHHAHYGKSPALIESNFGIPPALHFSSDSESGSGSDDTESSDDDVQDLALPTTSPIPSSSTPVPFLPKSPRPAARRRSPATAPSPPPSRPRRVRAQKAKYYEVDNSFFEPDASLGHELEAVKAERDLFAEDRIKLSLGLCELRDFCLAQRTRLEKFNLINIEYAGHLWCLRKDLAEAKAQLAVKSKQPSVEGALDGRAQAAVKLWDSTTDADAAKIVEATSTELATSSPLASTSSFSAMPPAALVNPPSGGNVSSWGVPPSPDSLVSSGDSMEGVMGIEQGGWGGQVKPPLGEESREAQPLDDLFYDFTDYAQLQPTVGTAFIADDLGAWARGQASGVGAEEVKPSSWSVEQELEKFKLKLHEAELSNSVLKQELDVVCRRHQDEIKPVIFKRTQDSHEKQDLQQMVASLQSDLKTARKTTAEEQSRAILLKNELSVVNATLADALQRADNTEELEQIKTTAATSQARVVQLEAQLAVSAEQLANSQVRSSSLEIANQQLTSARDNYVRAASREKGQLVSQLAEKTAECTALGRQVAEFVSKKKARAEVLSKAKKVLEEGRGGWGKKS